MDLNDKTNEGRPSLDANEAREKTRRLITTDRIKRLQILDLLWKRKRTGERVGTAASGEISTLLEIEKPETLMHLDTLDDLGLIENGGKTANGYQFIKITGQGITIIEEFFLKYDEDLRKSTDGQITKSVQIVDNETDIYLKHEKYIQTMSTIQEGFTLGNNILRALGLS